MNAYTNDGFEYAEADQHYLANQTAAFEQETDDLQDLDGEPDELEEVPAGEASAKGRNYSDTEKMTVLRQWGMRKRHLVGKQAQKTSSFR